MTDSQQHTNVLATIAWPYAVGLGLFALVRPIASNTGLDDLVGRPLLPIVLTLAISLVWILVVGLSRVRQPFLTLVAAGAVYAVAATLLSAPLSLAITGELQGPLTNPFAVVSVLITNLIWGAAAGGIAVLVQRMRRGSAGSASSVTR
jgi:hypothetical protein